MDRTRIIRTISAIVCAVAAMAGISYGIYSWLGLTAMIVYLAVVAIALVWTLVGMKHAIWVEKEE